MNPKNILIVDDEDINLDLLSAILKPEGFAIHRAYNGIEAVQRAAEVSPDLVIMDVRMPKMDGFEACQAIKKRQNGNFLPVILLTNLTDIFHQVQGLDSGADDYLIKPPRKEELLARVRAMMRIRNLHSELLYAQQTIQNDLDEVGKIQRSFLPQNFPLHLGIRFGHFYGPCQTAGGDYYDVIEIGSGRLGVLVADVTGHGAPAAVVMAITHTLMHSIAKSFHYPSTVLKVLNERLHASLAPTIYVTMFYGILNTSRMSFRYASAGHESMILFKAKDKTIHPLKTRSGFPLKLMESDNYDEVEIPIESNDKIVLFTDGLVERRSESGDFFGHERVEQSVLNYHQLPAQEMVDKIIEEAKSFAPGQPFNDDVTLFIIERTS